MRSKVKVAAALEDELMRLNTLVRERREQLDKLTSCPNSDCPCRVVWKDQVEKKLAGQVHRIRKHVHASPKTASGNPALKARQKSKLPS